MTVLIDGRKMAAKIMDRIKTEIMANKFTPKLAILIVGDDKASEMYVKMKMKACSEVGMENKMLRFNSNVHEDILINTIHELNNDSSVDAILVQLPLPEQFNTRKILDTIDPRKDVDGLTSSNLGKVMTISDPLPFCTPKGILLLIKSVTDDLKGKHAVIVNHSPLVGRPLSQLLLNEGMTVTVCHEFTKDLGLYTRQADILITAVGKHGLITADLVKENCILIDAGVEIIKGKTYGDVAEDVLDKVAYITPVPGGVGPMTIAMLLENTLLAYKQ